MGLLEGKNIVITGVLTDASLAFGVATLAQNEGAEVMLTGAGRALSLTERTARKLPKPAPVYELDVTVPEHLESCPRARPRALRGRVDGVLHSIGFAPEVCLGDDFMAATWDDVSVAMNISAYSYKALADAFLPLMDQGGAFVGLDLRQHGRVARVQLDGRRQVGARERQPLPGQGARPAVASAPTSSPPARSRRWPRRASPASRSSRTSGTTALRSAGTSTTRAPSPRPCVALLSDWFPATTGSMIHVDGGYHAVGA